MNLWRFLLLDDAYYYLNQARSFSDTPTARAARSRCIRSSILCAWSALEDAAKDALIRHQAIPVPRKLSEKLENALKLAGSASTFDANEYRRYYAIRNNIVHANTGAPDPTLQDATEVFSYCKKIISNIIPVGPRNEILIEIHSM